MNRRPPERPRVVVLGGGFAGLAAALELDAKRCDVTLVDRRRWFEFLPNIHELLSGVKSPELLRLPLDEDLAQRGHRFVRDTVTAIDPAARTVSLQRRRALSYDALIVALGGIDATRGVPGVAEHALPFKSVDECARIGRKLARLAARKRPARIVIVGGGLEGVEALGEILRLRPTGGGLHVTLVEARKRLLPETPAVLDRHVRSLCSDDEVTFVMGTKVRAIEAERVRLVGGRALPSELTIWTGGPAPSPLLAESGLAPEGAWAPVATNLQSRADPDVFIVGDAADLPKPLEKQGYHAIEMGVRAARNAARRLAGRPLREFRPSGKPTLISFGDRSCFLVAGRRVLAGPALGAAKEAVFELVMSQLDARPLPTQVPRIARSAKRATRRLLWPAVSSPTALRRQGRFDVLSLG